MATTRIIPLHVGKGRTESRAISDIIDYVANPQKTDGGKLITGFACDSRVADAEFMLAKRQYIAATGRVRGKDDVIAYHVRQSFVPGEITPEEALRALEKIEHSLSFRPWQLCVAAAVSSGGFAVMFGGGVAAFFVGVVTAGLVQALTCLLGRYRLEGMVSTLVGSFFATLLPLLFYHFTHVGTVDACVAGALMPLLPGLAMTNAVQDTMRGDIVSGVAHGMNAILTATLVAGGALIASSLYHVLMGGA